MSGDRKTRRRFIADLLFAGGALTAASVMGYAATHHEPAAVPTEIAAKPVPSPAQAPTPMEMLPDGDVAVPVQQASPPQCIMPAGAPPPPRPSVQGKAARPVRSR